MTGDQGPPPVSQGVTLLGSFTVTQVADLLPGLACHHLCIKTPSPRPLTMLMVMSGT